MKKIFLGLSLIGFMAMPALASNDRGKKKAKKKARTECKNDKCDPKHCDPKCIDMASCKKEAKCTPTCTGN